MNIRAQVSRFSKLGTFAKSRSFRKAKIRQWALPLLRKLYGNISLVGVRGADGKTTILHAEDDFITVDYIKFGFNTQSRLANALKILKSLNSPFGGIFLDVGANVGTETIAALRSGLFSRAFAIEPEPENALLLRINAILHNLNDRVVVCRAGASNKDEAGTLLFSSTNRGDHRVVTGDSGATDVEIRTLNTHLLNFGLKPSDVSLVWIDTQGFEGFVLAGASELLFQTPFVIEFWPAAMRTAGSYDLCLEVIEERFEFFYNLDRESSQPLCVSSLKALGTESDDLSIDLMLIPKNSPQHDFILSAGNLIGHP